MNVNLEYYRVFYYVCVHGSLTAAARELCISQPAVSQAVRQLERKRGLSCSCGRPKVSSLLRRVNFCTAMLK